MAETRIHSNFLLEFALFGILYTSDIKFGGGGFGVPIWLFFSLPLLFVECMRLRSVWQFLLIFSSLLSLMTVQFLATWEEGITDASRVIILIPAIATVLSLLIITTRHKADSVTAVIRATKWFLIMQSVTMLVQIPLHYSGSQPYYHYIIKAMVRAPGLFTEPSHVAVALTPAIMLAVAFRDVFLREIGVIAGSCLVFICLACPSATLVAPFVIAGLTLGLTNRLGAIITGVTVVLVLLFLPPIVVATREINPVSQRVYDLVQILTVGGHAYDASQNASSVILSKGLYITHQSLLAHPLGVGFDNFINANTQWAHHFTVLYARWNERDSTSIIMKSLTEFGIPGFAFMLLGIIILVANMADTRNKAGQMLASFSVTIFLANSVRGAGYFDGGTTIAAAIAIRFVATWLISWWNSQRTEVLRRRSTTSFPLQAARVRFTDQP